MLTRVVRHAAGEQMPSAPCSEAKCPELARPGSARCDEHTREYERERSRRRREAKGGFSYYGQKWRNTSRKLRFENPICQRCNERLAEHAHHDQGYDDPYNRSKLLAVCAKCHGEIHGAAESGSEGS